MTPCLAMNSSVKWMGLCWLSLVAGCGDGDADDGSSLDSGGAFGTATNGGNPRATGSNVRGAGGAARGDGASPATGGATRGGGPAFGGATDAGGSNSGGAPGNGGVSAGGSSAAGGSSSSTGGASQSGLPPGVTSLFPPPNGTAVCPDPPLRITFKGPPTLGMAGKIQVLSAANAVVASVDMATPNVTDVIGGASFTLPRPVFVDGNDAVIYLKTKALMYGQTYYVTVDPGRSFRPEAAPSP